MDFTALYREHAAPLTAYFLRRTGDPERAADLTAETFAAALAGVRRFDPSRGPAVGWLYGIARNQLAVAQRRGRVEMRARRRLGMDASSRPPRRSRSSSGSPSRSPRRGRSTPRSNRCPPSSPRPTATATPTPAAATATAPSSRCPCAGTSR